VVVFEAGLVGRKQTFQIRNPMTDPNPGPLELSIIVVTYNSRRHVRDCLESVQLSAASFGHEVIVVDNASQDGTPDIIRNEFPNVRLIANPENKGFAHGNNLGIAQSQGQFIILLNPDAVVPPKTLDTLLKEMKLSSETGLLGCLLLNADRSLQQSFGYEVSFWSEVIRKLFFNLWENHRFSPAGWVLRFLHSRKREVAWVKGACMLARRQALLDAKLMDENFFMYLEDADLCQRIRQLGWHVRYTPEAQVTHFGGGSVQSNPGRSALEYRRSQLYYFKKHLKENDLKALKIYLSFKMRKNILIVNFRQWVGWGAPGPLAEQKQFSRETLSLVQSFQ
jgi:GT2 family glycosyltransferase